MASGLHLFNDKSERVCEVCKYQGITSQAKSYCTVCTEYLCKSCDTVHRGSKMSRDHTILTGTELPSATTDAPPILPIMFCDDHKTMLSNVYCTAHARVICGTCKIVSHGNCITTEVKEQTFQMKADVSFGHVMGRLESLKSDYENLKQMRKNDKDAVSAKIKNCLQEVNLFRGAINEKLDELEKSISEEFRELKNGMICQIESHVTIADDALFQINNKIASMTECFKSRNDDVIFIGMSKADQQAKECTSSLVKVQKVIFPIDISFKASDVIVGMIHDLQALGSIRKGEIPQTQERLARPKISILKGITEERKIDVGSKTVSGATFLPDGQLVVCCMSDGLKRLHPDFQFKDQLKIRAVNVATLNDTGVIVTQGTDKRLLIVKVIPNMTVRKIMNVDRICVGVDVHGDTIYVTCHDNPGNGEVIVLSKDGKLLRKLGVDNGHCMFIAPNFVKVNMDGSKVFVSDSETHVVTCLDNNGGQALYCYTNQLLWYPMGIYVDMDDNLLMCGQGSCNIHRVRAGGFKDSTIYRENGNIAYCCVARRESDGRLAVGIKSKSNKSLVILK